LFGVIGGVIAFGRFGLFIGRFLLAVYCLLCAACVEEDPPPTDRPAVYREKVGEIEKADKRFGIRRG
ncbi:AI-2E family transporter YdiK, partial [Escherichia coli]|nr:AI-2E family transporter YdiK [Escherichia coli]